LKIDLTRSELFDSSALDYDLYRPNYPAVVISEMAHLSNLKSSSRVLEVGCGTGQATLQLARRGYAIESIDQGSRMVSLAKRNCRAFQTVHFRIGKFESLRFQPTAYDLVFSAEAFHWIEPKVRISKAALLLMERGSFSLLYNYPGKSTDGTMEALKEVIEEESGGKLSSWDYLEEVGDWKEEIENSRLFFAPKLRRHKWTADYNATSYSGLFRTYSDFLSLPKVVQVRISTRIREVVIKNGGHIRRSYDSVLIHATKK
jgi:SAM-dependent methyltransferase